jgi:hypothetical protein
MRSVTLEEAQSSKEKLFIWAKSHKALSGRSLDEWIFSGSSPLTPLEKYSEYTPSPTPRVLQKNWKTPTEFPSCPQDPKITSICAYANKLQLGTIFSINQYSSSIVEDIAISKDKETLWVMCISTASKPYSLAEITIANDHYVHNNLGSFFQKKSAKKYYILAQGLEWEGGETFDDLC